MPASLSEIDNELSDSDVEQEKDQLTDKSDNEKTARPDDIPHGAAAVVGSCEYCDSVDDSRIFQCDQCDGRQCEHCCHTIHVCKPGHVLKEWIGNEWVEITFAQSNLRAKYATLCGVCDRVLAEAGGRLILSALLCDFCGLGVMCQACCFKKHEKEPLHRVKCWTGGDHAHWRKITLRSRGFVFQLGHDGERCPSPDREVSSLLIIAEDGVQRINVRYCRCRNQEGVAKSNWYQIKKNGWFPATLRHPLVCSVFESTRI
ncbi:hypothetical protein C8R47DRAFT_1220844 [Mycena vitilis]|nr:hypothetical protein C8R47DRAFT_1220844 [Mycena vitilis]